MSRVCVQSSTIGLVDTVAVAVVLVVRNSASTLPAALESITSQRFPRKLVEVILVDGESSDLTFELLEAFKTQWGDEFNRIVVLSNGRRTLASGWNMALSSVNAPLIVRFDAHAWLESDYLSIGAAFHRTSELPIGGVGGWLKHEGRGVWGRAIAAFYSSRVGGGAATYRRRPPDILRTDTAVFAMYKTQLLREAGGFDERLVRNQDIDMHKRLIGLGVSLFTHPGMVAHYRVRSTLGRFIAKSWEDGYWVARSKGIRLRHLVPFAFVSALIFLIASAIVFGSPWATLLTVFLATYAFSTAGAMLFWRTGVVDVFSIPAVFFLGHVAYGAGTLRGLLSRATGKSR